MSTIIFFRQLLMVCAWFKQYCNKSSTTLYSTQQKWGCVKSDCICCGIPIDSTNSSAVNLLKLGNPMIPIVGTFSTEMFGVMMSSPRGLATCGTSRCRSSHPRFPSQSTYFTISSNQIL